MDDVDNIEIKDKWRLVLGKSAEEELPLDGEKLIGRDGGNEGDNARSRRTLEQVDELLDYVYADEDESSLKEKTSGGNEKVQLTATNWLNSSKQFFPQDVYEVIQSDAIKRGHMSVLLGDDEFVKGLEPNMNLLTAILNMRNRLDGNALRNANMLVNRVVEQLREKFNLHAHRCFYGKRDLSATPVRSFKNLDMQRIIRSNLKNYQHDGKYIIPERLFFRPNSVKRPHHDLFIVLDQSGSMLDSYAYSAIVGSVFARLPSLTTNLIIYSSDVVDYTPFLDDVLELLFKSQLSGGTETTKALSYVEERITTPNRTIVVLVSDLYDFNVQMMNRMIKQMIANGVKFIVLPALSSTAPSYDHEEAKYLSGLGAHVGLMTPERLIEFVGEIVRKA